jgi:predicted nuclease of restriction endonuclease-like (RecB) superfamily
MSQILPEDYVSLLTEVKERVRAAQYEALRTVNKQLVSLYFDIGRLIAERQSGNSYGRSVVRQLSIDLRTEFPAVSGFSERNLWYAREFFLTYNGNEKLQPLVAEIGWAHNILIFEKCKDDFEREFYLRMTKRMGWTKNVLGIKIDTKTYEKTLQSQTNFETTLPAPIQDQAKLALKSEYLFDFLELGAEFSERELEKAILSQIEPFLREMNGRMAFVGSQYRLDVGGQEFFIDLLLYHRKLRCLVAIDLKIGDFLPEYAGKMQFYLTALDRQERSEGENKPIGIILCRSKNATVVEYALADTIAPMGVATYHLTTELPQELQGELPDAAHIGRLLDALKE